jgi:ribonuclease E
MTEVPDKQSEGTGDRSRGRGRTRRTPVAAVAAGPAPRGRSRVATVETGDGALVAMPGEKLSRAAVATTSVDSEDADFDEATDDLEPGEGDLAQGGGDDANTEEGRRRRRRRGGRGRGRARGREDGSFAEAADGAVRETVRSIAPLDDDAEEADEMPAPARRAASAFGSVWDSQIGKPAGAGRGTPVVDDDDFDEPAVPEYLIAERRQRDNARGGIRGGGGGRGRGGAYAAALDRERFGGGRGSTPSRFQQPAPGNREPNFNRSDRPERVDRSDRQPFRPAPRPAPRPSGDEPWSEVPPEIEAMLRAQLGSRPAPRPQSAPVRSEASSAEAAAPAARRGRRPAAVSVDAVAPEGVTSTPEAAPKARRTAVRKPKAEAADGNAPTEAVDAAPAKKPARAAAKPATRTTASRSKAQAQAAPVTEAASTSSALDGAGDGAAAPKRRVTRRKAVSES